MWLFFALLGLAVLSLPLAIAIRRGPDLFVIDVVEGRCQLRRGRIPPGLMAEIEDIVRRNRLGQGRILARVEGGCARVLAHQGCPEGALQQLRNVVGGYRIAQLRAGRRRP